MHNNIYLGWSWTSLNRHQKQTRHEEALSLNAPATLFCREIYSSARNKDRKRDKEETRASKRKGSRYSIVPSLWLVVVIISVVGKRKKKKKKDVSKGRRDEGKWSIALHRNLPRLYAKATIARALSANSPFIRYTKLSRTFVVSWFIDMIANTSSSVRREFYKSGKNKVKSTELIVLVARRLEGNLDGNEKGDDVRENASSNRVRDLHVRTYVYV